MTPPQDDLTHDDDKVMQTDNGWHPGDGPQPVQNTDPATAVPTPPPAPTQAPKEQP